MKNILILIRPHQYIKNTFIFLPLFFAGGITELDLLLNTVIAFFAFSLSASAIYILNDYQDIEDDLQHPKKRYRPLASGKVTKNNALVTMWILFVSGGGLMAFLSLSAAAILGAYIILNIAYSFVLKHIAILDVTIISIGFVLRLYIGSTVTGIQLSTWIVIMTFLLALFISLAKRRDDIIIFNDTGNKMRKSIDGYNLEFIDGAMNIMAAVVIVAYIRYTTSVEIVQRLGSEYIYLSALFVVMGVMRFLQISHVENNSDSPTKIVLKDLFLQLTIFSWLLSFIWIIYL
jgi:4-hydroxybenzoate polyprenyltransferase